MIKSASFFVGAALLASAAVLPLAALAQSNQATMPVLYNQSGQAVNTGNTAVPAGYYYLQTGGAGTQVYYYGNGVYYNPAIGEYGGSVSDPNGTAGRELGYVVVGSTLATNNPGVPNTGNGGNAPGAWALLIVSGIVVLAGAASLTYAFMRPTTIA
jgi:hypothetical protein